MNQPQRSFSNIGLCKSNYMDNQNRTSSAFYKREEPTRYDQSLIKYEEFKRNYKKSDIQYSYYQNQPFKDLNRSYIDERYTYPNKIKMDNSLSTQQYDYDRESIYKMKGSGLYSPIFKIDNNQPIQQQKLIGNQSTKTGLIEDTAQYLKERDQILNSFMSEQEIERIKRIYYRK